MVKLQMSSVLMVSILILLNVPAKASPPQGQTEVRIDGGHRPTLPCNVVAPKAGNSQPAARHDSYRLMQNILDPALRDIAIHEAWRVNINPNDDPPQMETRISGDNNGGLGRNRVPHRRMDTG
ncbi:MAG: hypothetical protein AAB091_06650 [Elusimicrobiota bacterium]